MDEKPYKASAADPEKAASGKLGRVLYTIYLLAWLVVLALIVWLWLQLRGFRVSDP